MRPTSFVSEHTVEYAVVFSMTTLLKKYHQTVVPVFPWITREGSEISRRIHKQDTFKAVIVFPRRPKLGLDQRAVSIRMSGILESASIANDMGLTALAAAPIAQSLWELDQDEVRIAYISLDRDSVAVLSSGLGASNASLREYEASGILLDSQQLESVLLQESTSLTISDLVDFVRLQRTSADTSARFFFGPRYRPVFFLCRN